MDRTSYLPHLPDQRFSLHEALRGYRENLKGKLQVGMLAEIVVLSEDIEAVQTNDIPSILPIATIRGGKITFEAAQ